jgi:DNA uptake protein ComE-like DNA-binding protein
VSRRRGTILLSTLIVVVIAALIGTSMLLIGSAQRASVASSGERAQTRAIAMSGLRAVVGELVSQRNELLRGADPRITESWTLFEDGDRAGVVRLLPVGPAGKRIASEAARLDVNAHPAERLAALEALGPVLAERIASEAKSNKFHSVSGLLSVSGVTPELLFGSAAADDGPSMGDAVGAADATELHLADLLTVFAFEPNVQSGLGANRSDEFLGRRRINLNRAWSERLGRQIERRYDEDLARGVKGAMDSGLTFPNDEEVYRILVDSGLEPEQWGTILDGFTAWGENFYYGKVDINRAPAEVIACLPGVTWDVAEAIVATREQLGTEERRSVAWPVVEGIMDGETFKTAGPWMAVRSLQWRVRIAGGFVERDSMQTGMDELVSEMEPEDGFDAETDGEALLQPVILEVVVDLAGRRPRIAYLRDVSMLESAQQIRRATLEVDETAFTAGDDELPDDAVAGADDDPWAIAGDEAIAGEEAIAGWDEVDMGPDEDAAGDGSARDKPGETGDDMEERTSDRDGVRSEASETSDRPGGGREGRRARDHRIGRWRTGS